MISDRPAQRETVKARADWKLMPWWVRAWFVALFVMLGGMFLLMWFDTSTELTPDHDETTTLLFGAAVPFALAGIPVAWRSQPKAVARAMACIGLPLAGAIGFVLAGMGVSKVVWNVIDFPGGHTKDYPGVLLQVSRAYRTHGKGAHDAIQIMPIFADINVKSVDYDFMLVHRRPDDHGHDSDEIASKGWFCASVTLQQAGSSVRVLHAGSWSLPEGSLQLCPVDEVRQSHILMWRGNRLSARPEAAVTPSADDLLQQAISAASPHPYRPVT